MPRHLRVELRDHADGPTAAAFDSGRMCCFAQANTKQNALEELELRLVCVLQAPFTLHIEDHCAEPDRPQIKVLMEDVVYCGLFIATAFDHGGSYVCDGACCCPNGALEKCVQRLGRLMGSCDVSIEILNPPHGDD